MRAFRIAGCGSMGRRVVGGTALIIAELCASHARAAQEADKGSDAKPNAIVCLHTEYLPNPHAETGVMETRIARELGRQAVLVAARDELGLRTRDETLGEPFPESVTTAKRDISVRVRAYRDGKAQINLWTAAASTPERGEVDPAAKSNKHNADAVILVADKFEEMSRHEIVDKLRANGFDGKTQPADEANVPSDEIEGQLLEMNFVSQFAAVRSAHAAIAAKGQSRTWLAVLARGYANLAIMTEHHWNSNTEAFAARALLYALRLSKTGPKDPIAQAHLAYVEAVVGLHSVALKQLNRVDELRKAASNPPSMPNWVELIRPYCTFKREPLFAAAVQRKSLRQLAHRLAFEHTRAIQDNNLVMQAAQQCIASCPEEYSVYGMISQTTTLGLARMGASNAPIALAQFLPARVAALSGLPKTVRDAANGANSTDASQATGKANEDDSSRRSTAHSGYAAATFPIVKALRAVTANGDGSEPSWSMLGELIDEELFVQAANYLAVSMNATESSHEAEVNKMMPVLKDHRYAPYIACFAVNATRDPDKYSAVLDTLQIVDPRGNMWDMLARIWHMKDSNGKNERGINLSWRAYSDCGLTFTDMREAAILQSSVWWDHVKLWRKKEIADDFQAISPFSPQTLRIKFGLVDEPSAEQLAEWEAEAGEDPSMFVRLGNAFQSLKRFDDAIRCFERSIKMSPSQDAFVSLAEAYRASGREEMWLPTLERFFEVPSHGLEQASVHQMIADDLIEKGKWSEAEPHALAAAQTWSAWGMLLASRVYEALGRWDESEKWVREAATAYPSNSGDLWYFWCRRTGRGDVEAARKLAEHTLSAERFKRQLNTQGKLLTHRVVENDIQGAFEIAKNYVQLGANQQEADYDIVYEQTHLALLATELKQTDVAHSTIQEIRRASEAFRKEYPDFSDVNVAVCDVLEGKPPSAEAIVTLNDQLKKKINQESRCNYRYFLGRAYDLTGNKELAEKYWMECVSKGPFDRHNATLAGKYLCDRHKTSRP